MGDFTDVWHKEDYDLLPWNCALFAHQACLALTGQGAPERARNLAGALAFAREGAEATIGRVIELARAACEALTVRLQLDEALLLPRCLPPAAQG